MAAKMAAMADKMAAENSILVAYICCHLEKHATVCNIF